MKISVTVKFVFIPSTFQDIRTINTNNYQREETCPYFFINYNLHKKIALISTTCVSSLNKQLRKARSWHIADYRELRSGSRDSFCSYIRRLVLVDGDNEIRDVGRVQLGSSTHVAFYRDTFLRSMERVSRRCPKIRRSFSTSIWTSSCSESCIGRHDRV